MSSAACEAVRLVFVPKEPPAVDVYLRFVDGMCVAKVCHSRTASWQVAVVDDAEAAGRQFAVERRRRLNGGLIHVGIETEKRQLVGCDSHERVFNPASQEHDLRIKQAILGNTLHFVEGNGKLRKRVMSIVFVQGYS